MHEQKKHTNRNCLGIAFAILALVTIHTAGAAPVPIICPTELRANIAGNFQLIGVVPGFRSLFYTLNIVEGKPGDEAKYAPAALVPDVDEDNPKEIIDTWNLAPRDTPMLMICSYQGTSSYLRAVIPQNINRCKLTVNGNPPVGQCW